MIEVHSTAVVENGAHIGKGVKIGAYCTVGPHVVLEDGVVLHPHAVVTGHAEIGSGTEIFSFAVVGGPPQDLSYKGEETRVVVEPNCIVREHVTIHRGTQRGRQVTRIGANSFIMIGAHIAHDCQVGEHVILTNGVTLGGHVEIGDHAILGGLTAVQQRTRIGTHAFIGGMTGVQTDILPFSTATGFRAYLGGLNIVGLKRRGFDRETLLALRTAYKQIFSDDGSREERLRALTDEFGDIPAVMVMVDFVRGLGRRHLCTPRGAGSGAS